jgi:hypothetical protein
MEAAAIFAAAFGISAIPSITAFVTKVEPAIGIEMAL